MPAARAAERSCSDLTPLARPFARADSTSASFMEFVALWISSTLASLRFEDRIAAHAKSVGGSAAIAAMMT